MTKEEVEKEAEESWQNDSTVSGASMPNKVYVAGYLAGVGSSEKRIKDLEKEKSEIINLINDCLWSCVNKNFDKVEEGLKSLLNEYDE